jgi:hypothetical protein
MRTHGSNQFKADKSDSSKTSPYGRQHARTAELYRQRREQRVRAQQQSPDTVQQEPMKAQTPPIEMRERPANVVEQPRQEVAQPAAPEQPEQPSGKARQAVASVLQVAKEAHPLQSARKLAGTVVSGAVRVAREVSARAKKAKGPGKKG